jgi:hypothetical protein
MRPSNAAREARGAETSVEVEKRENIFDVAVIEWRGRERDHSKPLGEGWILAVLVRINHKWNIGLIKAARIF